ncbi:MAG: hypothetical protein RLZZ589_37 [Cyanobacteriota bacterium]
MADADTPTPNGEQLQSTDPSIEAPTAEAPITAELSAAEPTAVEQPADEPQVASTVTVPATPAAPAAVASAAAGTTPSSDEGGEWDLLVSKVQSWLASGQLQQQWQAARTPISLLAGLIALLLVLRIYGALLAVLDSIPLLPGLMELAGLIAVVQFTLTKMVRSSDRRQVIDGVRQRWQSFRGRS